MTVSLRRWILGSLTAAVCLAGSAAYPADAPASTSTPATFIRINGEAISIDEFNSRVERVPVQTPQGTKTAGQYTVEQLIGEKLIAQLAKKEGVEPTDTQIDYKLKNLDTQTENNLDAMLRAQGMTKEELVRKVRAEQALINVMTKGMTISDLETKAAYDAAVAGDSSPFARAEQVKISIVMCNSKDTIDKAHKALAKGAEFGSVSAEYSDDPNVKSSRGELNWLSKADTRVPQKVRDAAFALKVGKYSTPMIVSDTWVIVRADERRPKTVTPFDDVKVLIKEQLALNQASRDGAYKKKFTDFVQAAAIDIQSDRYKAVSEMIKKQLGDMQPTLPEGMLGQPSGSE